MKLIQIFTSYTGWIKTRPAQKLLVRVKFTGNPYTRTELVSMWTAVIEIHANCLLEPVYTGTRTRTRVCVNVALNCVKNYVVCMKWTGTGKTKLQQSFTGIFVSRSFCATALKRHTDYARTAHVYAWYTCVVRACSIGATLYVTVVTCRYHFWKWWWLSPPLFQSGICKIFKQFYV